MVSHLLKRDTRYGSHGESARASRKWKYILVTVFIGVVFSISVIQLFFGALTFNKPDITRGVIIGQSLALAAACLSIGTTVVFIVNIRKSRRTGGARDESSFTQKGFFFLGGITLTIWWISILTGSFNFGIFGSPGSSSCHLIPLGRIIPRTATACEMYEISFGMDLVAFACSIATGLLFIKCRHPFTSVSDAFQKKYRGELLSSVSPRGSLASSSYELGCHCCEIPPHRSLEVFEAPKASSPVPHQGESSKLPPIYFRHPFQDSEPLVAQGEDPNRPNQCTPLNHAENVSDWLCHTELPTMVLSCGAEGPDHLGPVCLYVPKKCCSGVDGKRMMGSYSSTTDSTAVPSSSQSRRSSNSSYSSNSPLTPKLRSVSSTPAVPPIPVQYRVLYPQTRHQSYHRRHDFNADLRRKSEGQAVTNNYMPKCLFRVERNFSMPQPALFRWTNEQERLQEKSRQFSNYSSA